MSGLKSGQLAPEFELPDQDGNLVRLSQFRGKSVVVIFFYPKDDTTGCTKEACGFRDSFHEFESKGARILGISSDSCDSHRRFVAKFNLQYPLLSDEKGRVRALRSAIDSGNSFRAGRASSSIGTAFCGTYSPRNSGPNVMWKKR